MKRYVISPMEQTGPYNITSGELGWQPKVARIVNGRPQTAVSGVTPVDFAAPGAWAFCIVETPDWTDILADSTIEVLPAIALDNTLGTLPAAARSTLNSNAANRGIPGAAWNTQAPFRNVVRGYGQKLHGPFDENNFDANPF